MPKIDNFEGNPDLPDLFHDESGYVNTETDLGFFGDLDKLAENSGKKCEF